MSEKQVKIVFTVDETAARKARLVIDDLTRAVEKLVAASSRVGAAMGGVGGGGNVGGVNIRSGRAPAGGAAFMAAGGTAKGGGIVANVLGVADATSLRTLITGTQQGFQSVAGTIKTFVDKSVQDIRRLQAAVDGLGKSMGGARMGGGGGMGGYLGGGSSPAGWRGGLNLDTPLGSVPGMSPPGKKPPGGSGGGGVFAAVQDLAKGDLRGFSSNMGVGLPIVAGVGAGIALGSKVTEFITDERQARVNQVLNQPFDVLSRRSAMAAPFLQLHGAVNSRDVNSQRAYLSALNDPDIMESLGKTRLRTEALDHATMRTTTFKGAAKEAWNDFRKWAAGKTGLTTDDAYAYLQKEQRGDVDARKTMRDIVRDNALGNMDPEAAAQFQASVNAKRALQDPTTSMLMDRVYGGAQGRVATMRAMGLSTKNVIRRGKDGQQYETSLYEDMEQKLSRGAWTMGDQAAGHQQLLQVGAGYGRAVGPIGLVSAGIGGLGNAAALVQQGGMMGGSVAAGRYAYDAVQRSVGQRGLDVAVGRDLFGATLGRAAATGQYGGSRAATQYAGMAAGLIGGGSETPYDVGGQQRLAGLVQLGNAGFAQFTSGSKAPLYQATSLMGAVAAAGGYGGKAEALTQMDPALLTAIARGGDVPPWAASLGIGKDDALKFLQYQRRAPLFEVTDALVPDQAGATLGAVRAAEGAGGDFMTVIQDKVGKRGAGESARAYQRRRADAALGVATDLGAAMYASRVAGSPEEGAGIFLGQMAQDKDFAPYLKGRGVGAAAPKGAEKAALGREADLTLEHGKVVPLLEGILKALAPATDLEKGAGIAVGAIAAGSGGAGLPGAIGNVITALEGLRARINSQQPRKVR